jgi:hypothetical protein
MKLKIISDGTSTGTKLINEESGEIIRFVQKISWSASMADFLTYTSIDLVNVPVDIVTKAEIHELDIYDEECNVYESEVRIVTNVDNIPEELMIYDNKTQTPIGSISEISLEITTDSIKAKIKKVKSDVEEAVVGLDPVNSREFGDILTKIYRV